jgi:hypothetical protein
LLACLALLYLIAHLSLDLLRQRVPENDALLSHVDSLAVKMSDTNRCRKRRQAPTESSNHSEANENLSTDDASSPPGTATFDETFSQVSKGKRRRKRFNLQRRKEVANVRKVGACTECRARKVAVCQPVMFPVKVIPLTHKSDANVDIGSASMRCKEPMPISIQPPYRSPPHNHILSSSRQHTLTPHTLGQCGKMSQGNGLSQMSHKFKIRQLMMVLI